MDTLAVVKKAARRRRNPRSHPCQGGCRHGKDRRQAGRCRKAPEGCAGFARNRRGGHLHALPPADEGRDPESLKQIEVFTGLLRPPLREGIRPPLAHMCNSAATIRFPRARLDMVRTGLVTYGLVPYPGKAPFDQAGPAARKQDRVRQGSLRRVRRLLWRHIRHETPVAACHRAHWIRRRVPPVPLEQGMRGRERNPCSHRGQGMHGSDGIRCH